MSLLATLVFADRVQETSTTTGSSDFTLAGAATGKITFNTGVGVGPVFPYLIDGGTEWEVGIGHLSGSTTLVRDQILSSSNSNAVVTFSAGTKQVALTVPSDFLSNAIQTNGLGAMLARGAFVP